MKELSAKKKLWFTASSLVLLGLGTAAGFSPRFLGFAPEEVSVNLPTYQLAAISYQLAATKEIKKSHEVALIGLSKGYQQPTQAHWFLSHLGWLESQTENPSLAVDYYRDLLRLRSQPTDSSNYAWALSQSQKQIKAPKSVEEALTDLEAAQDKIVELTEKIKNGEGDFAEQQLEAWHLAKKVELLIHLLERPAA